MNVEEHRARGVGVVGGEHPAARQPPYKICIHRAEQQLSPLRALPCARDIIQNPFEFGRRKVGVGNEPRLFADKRSIAVARKFGAALRRAAALPHDGVAYGLTRRPVPHERGFALVGYADGGDIARLRTRNLHRALHGAQRGEKQFLGVVLDEPRRGIYLRNFAPERRHYSPRFIEEHGARAGCALVEGDYVFHGIPLNGAKKRRNTIK